MLLHYLSGPTAVPESADVGDPEVSALCVLGSPRFAHRPRRPRAATDGVADFRRFRGQEKD
eukprot:11592032-Alexandrium_andersonii.AAC.1